jgi:polyhydroxybutyrate depolymerase
VDDLAYLDAVRAVVQARVPAESWFATGLSNGGAMSYRLACARAGVIRGIAPLGAGNQSAAFPGCDPEAPVAVLDFHGTADACWGYETGTAACAQRDGGKKVGARMTLEGGDGLTGWATHLGCARAVDGAFATERVRLPDASGDGLWSEEVRYQGCAAPLVHVVTHGGGHTVPGGYAYLDVAGALTTDFLASERIVGFRRIAASSSRMKGPEKLPPYA